MTDIHSCSPFCERPECVKARAAVSAEASSTPRTDAEWLPDESPIDFGDGWVPAEFSRQLERELAEANERIDELERDLYDERKASLKSAASAKTDREPIGYAVIMDDGGFVGAWKSREIAELVCSKQPPSHHDRVVAIYDGPAELPSATPRRNEIDEELERALAKFPTWPTDPLHALAVLGEEFGELTKEMLQLTYEPHKTNAEKVRRESIQTAAMALRLYRSIGRYEYRPGTQHEQEAA